MAIGSACAGMKLLTGGSGLALGLPANFRRQGLLKATQAGALPKIHGHAVVLAGSCSAATQRQVAHMKEHCDNYAIDALALGRGADLVSAALAWATLETWPGHQSVYVLLALALLWAGLDHWLARMDGRWYRMSMSRHTLRRPLRS